MPNQFLAVTDRNLAFALAKRLQVTEDLGISIGPELTPVIDIDHEEELQYSLGWRAWSVSFGFAALAANAMKLQFQNPPTSQVIMLLEEITVSSNAADAFVVGAPGTANNANLATAIVVHGIKDGRNKSGLGAAPGGSASISTQQAPAAFSLVGLNSGRAYSITAGVSYTLPGRPYVLIPGTTIIMGFQGVNAQQAIQLSWRERMLNEAESAT